MRILVTGVIAAAAVTLPAPAGAAVRDCSKSVDFNLEISSARNMSCKAAKREQKSYRGSIKKHFNTPGGFHCSRVSGTRLGGQWRCVKGSRAYRFEFAD
jgi:hypothetical protein